MSDPLWINADAGEPEYNAQELRRAFGMLLTKGVTDRFGARSGIHPANDPAVTVAGTTWTAQHLVAVVYPGLTTTAGPYLVQHPSESGSLNPADGSNPRIDALDLQVQDDDEDASGERRARVVYVAGTPAASPVAPTVTANSLRLATVLVPAGGSPSPSVQSLSVFTVSAGGILPVRGSSELPTAGRYVGMAAFRQDLLTPVYWDGSGWAPGGPPAVQGLHDPSFQFTNTSFGVGSTGGSYADCGVSFVAPVTGRVKLTWGGGIRNLSASASPVAYLGFVLRTGGTVGSGTVVVAAADARTVRINATDNSTVRAMVSYLASGLTPGDTYNVRLEHRVTSSTGEAFQRAVMVEPMP